MLSQIAYKVMFSSEIFLSRTVTILCFEVTILCYASVDVIALSLQIPSNNVISRNESWHKKTYL